MIPMDLLKLIDKYNEDGMFFVYLNTLWWFNGKRFELWSSHFPINLKVYRSKNKKLYAYNCFDIHFYIHIEKKGYFFKSNKRLKYKPDEVSILDGNYYFFKTNLQLLFNNNGEIVKSIPKQFQGGKQIIAYNGMIYCFSHIGYENEKYCPKRNQWFKIARHRDSILQNIVLFNGLFYAQREYYLDIYDPELNQWKHLKYKIPYEKKISMIQN